jgi:hypothetical protein
MFSEAILETLEELQEAFMRVLLTALEMWDKGVQGIIELLTRLRMHDTPQLPVGKRQSVPRGWGYAIL